VCLCVFLCAHVLVSMCRYVHVCVCVHVHILVSICSVHVCMCVSVFMYLCLCVGVCLCVCMCTRVHVLHLSAEPSAFCRWTGQTRWECLREEPPPTPPRGPPPAQCCSLSGHSPAWLPGHPTWWRLPVGGDPVWHGSGSPSCCHHQLALLPQWRDQGQPLP
jgi:hypothetical protein